MAVEVARQRSQDVQVVVGQPDAPSVGLTLLEATVMDRIDDYVDQSVRRVAKAVPTLGPGSTVDLNELWTAVYCVLKTSLTTVAGRHNSSEREHSAWRQLGKRAAQLGVPLEDVTQALRVSCTTLWEALSQAALRLGEPCPYDVLDHAPTLWDHFDVMVSVISDAHHEVGTVREIEQSQLVCAFLAAIRRYPSDIPMAETLSRALELDPNGWFVAVVHDPVTSKPTGLARLVTAEEADRTVMVIQSPCPPPEGEHQASAVARDIGVVQAGIGIQRCGLAGAQQSLADAEAAYAAAATLDLPVVDFRSQWLPCLALQHRAQHESLVAEAVRHLQSDQALRDTVAAYLAAEASLPGAAAALGLHANTVAYRLRQLAERTGLDARSADGASLAQVALAFSGVAVPAGSPRAAQKAS